jgi:hypothetical protein
VSSIELDRLPIDGDPSTALPLKVNSKMFRSATLFLVSSVFFLCHSITAIAVEFSVTQQADGVTVELDGNLFTRYIIESGGKPILWPIIGPNGRELTRGYPMRDATEGEKSDHVHHRSLWFTHGDVNSTSFWDEGKRQGITRHREFVRVEGGPQAVIETRNDWLDAKEQKQCSDQRTVTFGANADSRWIDFDITLRADDSVVKFGDTKEGTFGVRVAGTMKVEAETGGRIVNSMGHVDSDAWGRAASWVDYHGPVDGEVMGIAIMNHPSSFRFPTYWHVRTYGLFAANPFGLHNFKNSDDVDGSHTMQPGESIALRYRVLLHKGDEHEGRVAEAFSEYAKVSKD